MRAAPGGRPGGGSGILRLLPVAIRFLGVKGTLLLGAVLLGYGFFSGNLSPVPCGGSFESPDSTRSSQPLNQGESEKGRVGKGFIAGR